MKPSVGRIVHVRHETHGGGWRCEAAIVTAVHSDACVNVTAFEAGGAPYSLTSLVFKDPAAEFPKGGTSWHWPERVD